MSKVYLVQMVTVGAAGKNSCDVSSYALTRLREAKDFFAESLVTNADMDPDLATSLITEWAGDEDQALEWSCAGVRGSTIIHRLEIIDTEV